MRTFVVLAAAAMLAGCMQDVGGPADAARPMAADAIRYETSACYGRCPVYAVTVRPDGTGVFEGRRFTAVTGTRAFTLTRAQYDAFAARLAPYRPASGSVRYAMGEKNCQLAVTDSPGVDVRWTPARGDAWSLSFYFGCRDAANRPMADALGGAVELLPVQDMIGPRP